MSTIAPPTEDPQKNKDIIKDVVKNPLDIANSFQVFKEIIDILSDLVRNNAWSVGDLLDDINTNK